jgi:hypothetical protein
MESKSFRVSLKLKEGKSPHLFIEQIKQMMSEDTSLHPMMEKTLKMLKKTRTPYIMLSRLRELVVDPENFRHFDRSADPKRDFVCTLWSKEEITQYKEDPDAHIKAMFNLFEKMGYEFYDSKECTHEYIKQLENMTFKQIEAQLKGRMEEEDEN